MNRPVTPMFSLSNLWDANYWWLLISLLSWPLSRSFYFSIRFSYSLRTSSTLKTTMFVLCKPPVTPPYTNTTKIAFCKFEARFLLLKNFCLFIHSFFNFLSHPFTNLQLLWTYWKKKAYQVQNTFLWQQYIQNLADFLQNKFQIDTSHFSSTEIQ